MQSSLAPISKTSWLTLPTVITLLRFALVPVFLAFFWNNQPRWAVVTFVVAGASDWFDGLLARLLDQRTRLGAFLDPAADKFLIFSALLSLTLTRQVPWWLLLLITFRDGLMIVGTLVVRHKNLELPTTPSRIGKYATLVLTAMVACNLFSRMLPNNPSLLAYVQILGFVSGLSVAVSTAQYLSRFGYLFFAPRRKDEGL